MKKNLKWQYDFIYGDVTSSDKVERVMVAAGIPLGIRGTYSNAQLVGIPQGCEGHTIIFGGSGSGKSTGPFMAAQHTWKGPMVVIDPKGEHYRHYKTLYDNGFVERKPIKFDPTDSEACRYDAFWVLRQNDKELMSNIIKMSHDIISMPPNCREPYWIETKQAVLQSIILFFFKHGENLSKALIKAMKMSLHEMLNMFCSESTEPRLKINLGSLADVRKEELSSHDRGLRNTLAEFTFDEFINDAFNCVYGETENSFVWDDLSDYNIFICIPEERIEQWSPAIRLMLTQLFTYLERRSDKFLAPDEPPILLLLDEIARFGKIEGITEALSTLRSRNVNIVLALQSLAQLDRYYGTDERRIICDNCQYKLILQASDPDTQRSISNLIGVRSIMMHGKGVSMNIDGDDIGYSRQKSEAYLPLVFPHELATLDRSILLSPFGMERLEKIRTYAPDFEDLLYSDISFPNTDQKKFERSF